MPRTYLIRVYASAQGGAAPTPREMLQKVSEWLGGAAHIIADEGRHEAPVSGHCTLLGSNVRPGDEADFTLGVFHEGGSVRFKWRSCDAYVYVGDDGELTGQRWLAEALWAEAQRALGA